MNTQDRILYSKVAGVTFEGRQDVIGTMAGSELAMLKPEPENKYDPNAIAVWIAFPPEAMREIAQIGYLPRQLAEVVAPYLEGENLICTVHQITGGFMVDFDLQASYGVVLRIELPERADHA